MTIAKVSQGSAGGLLQALRTAQEAIHLPESKRCCTDYLNTISASSCRICMTNKRVNSDRVPTKSCMWNPAGLEVSFQPTHEIANQTDRFLPVGWFWESALRRVATMPPTAQ